MIAWFTRLFHRRPPYQPAEPPETPATIKVSAAIDHMQSVDWSIKRTMRELQEEDGSYLDNALFGQEPPSVPRIDRSPER